MIHNVDEYGTKYRTLRPHANFRNLANLEEVLEKCNGVFT